MELDSQQALKIWHTALAETVRQDEPDLTARQLAILMSVFLEPPPHTVRGIAADLHVAKPVVTRAIDTLSEKGFVKRKKDENDRRSIFIQRTMTGAKFLNDFADLVVVAGQKD